MYITVQVLHFFSDFQKGTISPELCHIFKMRSKMLKWDTFSHNILKRKIKKNNGFLQERQ